METPPQQQKSPSIESSSSHTQASGGLSDYAPIFVHLFSIGQMLCGQTHGVADRFCQEVALATQGRAQLLLRSQRVSDTAQSISPPPSVSFSVQSRDRICGTLYVAPDPAEPANPVLPLTIAHLLAQTCGWLLYTFELAAFLQGPSQPSGQTGHVSLTKREQEVLALTFRGYDAEAIARALHITPATVGKHRQHIYEHLGVHNERDALLAAYQAGLFSPLEDLLG